MSAFLMVQKKLLPTFPGVVFRSVNTQGPVALDMVPS